MAVLGVRVVVAKRFLANL